MTLGFMIFLLPKNPYSSILMRLRSPPPWLTLYAMGTRTFLPLKHSWALMLISIGCKKSNLMILMVTIGFGGPNLLMLLLFLSSILNNDSSNPPWIGWKMIWKLEVPPRVKTFIWKLAHSKHPTCDVFYNLNFGPLTPCHFWHLFPELAENTFLELPRIIPCWINILASLGLFEDLINNLRSGNWLAHPPTFSCNPKLGRAVIAITH